VLIGDVQTTPPAAGQDVGIPVENDVLSLRNTRPQRSAVPASRRAGTRLGLSPMTPGTIVALERILRNYDEGGE